MLTSGLKKVESSLSGLHRTRRGHVSRHSVLLRLERARRAVEAIPVIRTRTVNRYVSTTVSVIVRGNRNIFGHSEIDRRKRVGERVHVVPIAIRGTIDRQVRSAVAVEVS